MFNWGKPTSARNEERGRIAAAESFKWLERFREECEAISYRPLRECLIELDQAVSKIASNLQNEPEDIQAEPILVTYLDELLSQLKSYTAADMDWASGDKVDLMREQTLNVVKKAISHLSSTYENMLHDNYFSVRVGNRTLDSLFQEGEK